MEENRASWLTAPMGMFLAWSASTFLIRAWAKLRTKTWGLDDYFLSLSLLLYAIDFLYVLALGLCRASAAFFISHMAHSGPQTGPARILAACSGVWTIASLFAVALRGDVSRPWSTLDGTQPMFIRWVSIETTGMIVELATWFLAIHLVWSLQMALRKRIYILSAFGVKLLFVQTLQRQTSTNMSNACASLFIFIGFRLAYLTPANNSDPTLTSIVPAILTQAVLHFSIIASCVTTLKPFLRHFDPTYVLESAEISTSKRSRTSLTNPSRDPYYRLGAMNRSNRSRGDPNDDITWRPYQGPTQPDRHASAYHDSNATQTSQSSKEGRLSRLSRTIADGLRSSTQSKQNSATQSFTHGDSASMRTDGSERMIIERTTEVSVEHEDSRP
ncbi:hypothetical protein PWT90_10742 [Aphanocladium album]|nr:hypothetical protein PWT90_10742 [Aphanocladium album]